MNDILPEQTPLWRYFEATVAGLLDSYGYRQIRMPIVEFTELFKRSIGEVTDIVEKEMYTFEDRNGDSLTLRPEGTASCVRAVLEHGISGGGQVQKLWYMGPMFRHERPQKGRYRQFHQIGAEALGFGGLLAHYAHEGVATYLITATRGERGWMGDPAAYPGAESLGSMREGELLAAAQILGIRETTFLDYMDGDLDQANPGAIIDTLVGHLRRGRPPGVAPLEPTGIYGHPDHIAICQFTTAAISAAANPHYVDRDDQAPHQVSKLYYRAWCAAEAAIYQQVFGDLVMTIDGVERRAATWPEWAFTTRLDATAPAAES